MYPFLLSDLTSKLFYMKKYSAAGSAADLQATSQTCTVPGGTQGAAEGDCKKTRLMALNRQKVEQPSPVNLNS